MNSADLFASPCAEQASDRKKGVEREEIVTPGDAFLHFFFFSLEGTKGLVEQ